MTLAVMSTSQYRSNRESRYRFGWNSSPAADHLPEGPVPYLPPHSGAGGDIRKVVVQDSYSIVRLAANLPDLRDRA